MALQSKKRHRGESSAFLDEDLFAGWDAGGSEIRRSLLTLRLRQMASTSIEESETRASKKGGMCYAFVSKLPLFDVG